METRIPNRMIDNRHMHKSRMKWETNYESHPRLMELYHRFSCDISTNKRRNKRTQIQNGMGTHQTNNIMLGARIHPVFIWQFSWQSQHTFSEHAHEIRWWCCEGNNATHSIYPLHNHLHISHSFAIDILLLFCAKHFPILGYWSFFSHLLSLGNGLDATLVSEHRERERKERISHQIGIYIMPNESSAYRSLNNIGCRNSACIHIIGIMYAIRLTWSST